VRFAFTDEQILFRDTVHDLLDKECQPEQVRFAWVHDDGRLRGLWGSLAEMGVLGIQVPEAYGGLALAEVDLVLLLEETGRFALPGPVVETVAVGAPLLAELAALADAAPTVTELAQRWLPAVLAGEAVIAVARATDPVVNRGGEADLVVVLDGDVVTLVAGEQVVAVAQPSVDGSRRLASVTWPAGAAVVASGPAVATLVARAEARATLGTAAQLLGLGDRLLMMTVAYAQERRQFGVPIGSFQAVKHHLADALLQLEFARPVVYAAAWALATDDPDAPRAVAHAKAAASDAASFAGRQALQVHGAIGYTVEYDLHLYLKRVWALAAAWGDAAEHRRKVADLVLGPAPTPAPT